MSDEHTHTPEEDLFALLKGASATSLETNEGVLPTNSPLHEVPEGSERASINSRWGDSTEKDQLHLSKDVWDESKRERTELLGRVFKGFDAATKAAKSTISQAFTTRDYRARSAMLEKVAHQRSPTLMEQARRLLK